MTIENENFQHLKKAAPDKGSDGIFVCCSLRPSRLFECMIFHFQLSIFNLRKVTSDKKTHHPSRFHPSSLIHSLSIVNFPFFIFNCQFSIFHSFPPFHPLPFHPFTFSTSQGFKVSKSGNAPLRKGEILKIQRPINS